MKLIGKLTTYDRIIAYLKDPEAAADSLTENERKMLDRRLEAFTLLRNYNSYADAAAILMKRFPGISRATAYRDCSDALSLFGDIGKAKKDGIRHLATEIAMDAIKIARMNRDANTMLKGVDALTDINAVNQQDPDLPDFSALEPHTYILGLPDNQVQAIQMMIKGGRIDLTQMMTQTTEVEDAQIIEEKDNERE